MSKVDDLIAQGAVQMSRKYRRVFVPPKDPVEWMREHRPEQFEHLVKRAAYNACQIDQDCHVQLTNEEFVEFYEKVNGRKIWSPEGKTPCSDCRSLGHIHRDDCSQRPDATQKA